MSFLALSPGFQLDDDQSRNTKNKIRERGAKRDHTLFIHMFIFSLPEKKRKQTHLPLFMCAWGFYIACFAMSLCNI